MGKLQAKKSDHFDGEKFFVPGIKIKKNIWQLLRWKFLENKKKSWAIFDGENATPSMAQQVNINHLSTTYVNHATHLIQLHQLNILTDPVFSNCVSPFKRVGPKRFRAPGIAIKDLPKIDFIVISHNHYDHLDLHSLKSLCEMYQPIIVVPLGNKKIIQKMNAKQIIELDWWESLQITPQQKITLVPAQHWSARSLWDANKALWGGFVIEADDLKVYFSGDTGYGTHFKKIHNYFGKIHVSILPIGAYEPRWFMKEQHINPEEAVLAHLDLNAHLSIASHHLTFQLTDEGVDEPTIELQKSLKKWGVSPLAFLIPENGATIEFNL